MQKVLFKIDKKKDKEVLLWFSLNPISPDGLDRFKIAIKNIQDLKDIDKICVKDRKRKIKKVVDKIYQKNKKDMQDYVKKVGIIWQEKEIDFLKEGSMLFDNHPWPKGKFTGYLTIMAIFPRDINKKTFQFPCKDSSLAVYVIAHEILHFIFYDYFEKNFKNKLDWAKVWELSEMLNDILFFKQSFSSIINFNPKVRNTLIKKTEKLIPIYENSNSMREFIEKAILFLKNGD